MPPITVAPEERLARFFKRKKQEMATKAGALEPRDLVRRNEPAEGRVDSGLSLFRVDRMSLLEAAKISARLETRYYGIALIRASELLDRNYSFSNRENNHRWHACARCRHCNLDESPVYCLPKEETCPFTLALEENAAVRKLFHVSQPAVKQPELLDLLAVSQNIDKVFAEFDGALEVTVFIEAEDEPGTEEPEESWWLRTPD